MVVFLWYLVKIDLSSVGYCTRVHWSSYFLQGTINTWLCITRHPVYEAGYQSNNFARYRISSQIKSIIIIALYNFDLRGHTNVVFIKHPCNFTYLYTGVYKVPWKKFIKSVGEEYQASCEEGKGIS